MTAEAPRPERREDPAVARLPQPPSERGPLALALALLALGIAVLVSVATGVVGSSPVQPVAPPAVTAAAPTPAVPAGTQVSLLTPKRSASGTVREAVLVRTVRRARARARARGGGPGRAGDGANAVAGSSAAAANGPHAGPGSGGIGAGAGSGAGAGAAGAAGTGGWLRFAGFSGTHIPASWMESFYPLYAEAQRTFGVNWLLIASVHKQETDFSTAPSTYHGLNFAGCCAGPMQFNVKNGPVSTWGLMRDSYLYNARPAVYAHRTRRHPSIYDDYDAIMAGAHLLGYNGAGTRLDDAAWWAAYDYYGHDTYGVAYADEVLARAISWSQHGFCVNCEVPPPTIAAVQAAWGAPVLAELEAQEVREAREARARRQQAAPHRRGRMRTRTTPRG
ncbi:MAG: hypothetical protein FWD42_09285 [Solirubrobacterales bacterium]|nr:hypothetical protein [Solirubrobacterales bacterium]